MARTADPLERDRDGARRTELAREVHRPDVDPQFERGGGHDGPDLPFLKPALGLQADLPREAAVMGQHRVLRQPLAQHVGQPLRHPPGVDEDQGGLVFLDERGDPVPDVFHDLVGGDRPEFGVRNLHRQVHLPPVADPNHCRSLRRPRAQKPRHLRQRPHRRREPDALWRPAGEPVEAFEGERQVAAALVAGERVDLVHDDGVGGREQFASAAGGEQQVERFRGGDQDVWRFPGHPGPIRGRGVARAEFGADRRERRAVRRRPGGNPGERNLEVPADVGAQRLQRGDVNHAGLVRKGPAPGLPG